MKEKNINDLFSEIFSFLAKNPSKKNITFAKKLYSQYMADFYISPSRLRCSESLTKLGLVKPKKRKDKS